MISTARILTLTLGFFAFMLCAVAAPRSHEVTLPAADGGTVVADLYGKGTRAVVLAHGAAFDKESWAPLAGRIEALGYQVLAIDFRGYGKSRGGSGGMDQDVLGAVRWLHKQGVKSVSVLGGSMGGGASAEAATKAKPGEIDKLVLLSPVPIDHPERLKARSILFIASQHEGFANSVRSEYQRAPKPKKLVMLEGSAHAQNIFDTRQSKHLTDTILKFFAAKK